MMLRGEKPLAVFTDGHGHFPEAVLRYLRLFDRRAARGELSKREFVVPDYARRPLVMGWHSIFYALPGEEWRIDAMIALRLESGWSREQEREEGRLLGYAEWQNEIWLAQMFDQLG